jgi:hypothetical protein
MDQREVILRVEQEQPEVLLVVVDRLRKVSRERCGCLGV